MQTDQLLAYLPIILIVLMGLFGVFYSNKVIKFIEIFFKEHSYAEIWQGILIISGILFFSSVVFYGFIKILKGSPFGWIILLAGVFFHLLFIRTMWKEIWKSKKDGLHQTQYNSGQLKTEEYWKNNQKHGKERTWYENGQLKSEDNYKNGLADGIQKSWYKNGQIHMEYNFNNGILHGVQRTWYENGQLEFEEEWKNEVLLSLKEWDEHGNITENS